MSLRSLIGLLHPLLSQKSKDEKREEHRNNKNPHTLEIVFQIGVAHSRMINERNHQIPEPEIGPDAMGTVKNHLQQVIPETKTHHRGGHRREGMLHRLHEPGTPGAVTDMPNSIAVVLKHANLVDLGPRNHAEAQVSHLMYESPGKSHEIYEKIGKIPIYRADEFHLHPFQPIQDQPEHHRGEQHQQGEDRADGCQDTYPVTPAEPFYNLCHRWESEHECLLEKVNTSLSRSRNRLSR